MSDTDTKDMRLTASGIMHTLENGNWLSIADDLGDLSDEDFDKLLLAFRIYRRSKKLEREDAQRRKGI